MMLRLRPITFRDACAFVAQHHRHNRPPRGHKFSISVYRGDTLAGVVMVGRPVARAFDDGVTAEINRLCTPGAPETVIDGMGGHHASPECSMLYGAARRAAKAMGYRRIVTYTQASESGSSLRAAGFRRVKDIEARGSWAEDSVQLKDIRCATGTGGVDRVLWEVIFP